MYILLIFSLFYYCSNYVKLSKYSSVEVKSNTQVYLDISSFDTGTAIDLEFEMDYLFSHGLDSYTFKIGQVDASSYAIYSYLENLPLVVNKNVSYKSSSKYDCIFSWSEIKKEGQKYIFIDALEPYDDFDFFKRKISITHIGGLSLNKIIAIVIASVIFIIAVVIIIICCINKRSKNINALNDGLYDPSFAQIYPQPVYQPQVYQQQFFVQPGIPVPDQQYQQQTPNNQPNDAPAPVYPNNYQYPSPPAEFSKRI